MIINISFQFDSLVTPALFWMDDTVVIGTKDFQVPKYFNFADVIDEWAQKEKVTMFFINMFCPTSLFVCLFVYSSSVTRLN